MDMDDFAKGSVAFAGANGVAIYTALKKEGYKPGLLVASLLVILNLAIGVYVSTTGRRRRIVAFVNFCACLVPFFIATAHGGEFKPDLFGLFMRLLPF